LFCDSLFLFALVVVREGRELEKQKKSNTKSKIYYADMRENRKRTRKKNFGRFCAAVAPFAHVDAQGKTIPILLWLAQTPGTLCISKLAFGRLAAWLNCAACVWLIVCSSFSPIACIRSIARQLLAERLLPTSVLSNCRLATWLARLPALPRRRQ
jgi:hypothetical protein